MNRFFFYHWNSIAYVCGQQQLNGLWFDLDRIPDETEEKLQNDFDTISIVTWAKNACNFYLDKFYSKYQIIYWILFTAKFFYSWMDRHKRICVSINAQNANYSALFAIELRQQTDIDGIPEEIWW